jgi:hypothetical protein
MTKEKFYIVSGDDNVPVYELRILADAVKHAQELANENRKKFQVFESISKVTPAEINEGIDTFEKACKYLKCDIRCHDRSKHYKRVRAFFKLIKIAEAWNKADEFIPDSNNERQVKYHPHFKIDENRKLLYECTCRCEGVPNLVIITHDLCFKTSKRAEQFGKQFIDLWNDFLIIK